jgi:RNA polymerase sigma factor (TIGR02999 family)
MPEPMSDSDKAAVTRLLLAWREGDENAGEELLPLVYQELHQLARRYMRDEGNPGVLQTTALVHEAYLRLVDLDIGWESRSHFYGMAARTMRRVLVDFARSRRAQKRGGGEKPLSLDENLVSLERSAELLALDDALEELAAFDPRKARVVELRYFGGLTIDEAAEVLQISHATVERDLRMAKAWLYRAMSTADADDGS